MKAQEDVFRFGPETSPRPCFTLHWEKMMCLNQLCDEPWRLCEKCKNLKDFSRLSASEYSEVVLVHSFIDGAISVLLISPERKGWFCVSPVLSSCILFLVITWALMASWLQTYSWEVRRFPVSRFADQFEAQLQPPTWVVPSQKITFNFSFFQFVESTGFSNRAGSLWSGVGNLQCWRNIV